MRAFAKSGAAAPVGAPVEPLRLAWIVDSLVTGGAERLVVTFAEEIARRSDVRLTVVALNDKPGPFRAELEALGVDLIVLRAAAIIDPRRFLRLVSVLRRRRIECVHAHLSGSIILGGAAAWLIGATFFATLHNVRSSAKQMSAVRRFLYGRALRAPSTRVVAVGAAVAESAQKEGVATPDIVPNAVSTPTALDRSVRTETRAELGVATDERLLLAVGKLIPQKAHQNLIDAFALIAATHPEARLAIAGDGLEGDYGRMLQSRIEELGLSGRAVLLGLRRDVPRLLAAADLFVSASDFEGAPVSLLEAMASGLACVMTDVGDNRLVLEGTGCTTPPPGDPAALAEPLAALLRDPAWREACGAAARARAVSAFGAAGWVERHLDLYGSLTPRRDWRPGSTLLASIA